VGTGQLEIAVVHGWGGSAGGLSSKCAVLEPSACADDLVSLCLEKQMARRLEAVTLGTGSSQSGRRIPKISRTELFSHRIWKETRCVCSYTSAPLVSRTWQSDYKKYSGSRWVRLWSSPLS
jgi:hypothetical protein